MDKQQATQFILNELKNHRTPDQIAAALSSQVGAPLEMVKKFVSQVMAENPSWQAAQETHAPNDLSFFAPDAASPNPVPEPPPPVSSSSYPSAVVSAVPPATAHPASVASAAPRPAQPSPPPLPTPDSEAIKSRQPRSNPELEAYILKSITMGRKDNDLVMELCEKESMTWDQAQRFVAHVRIQNRESLSRQQNIIVIVLSVGILLAGIALTLSSAQEAYTVYKCITDPVNCTTAADIDRTTIGAFVGGLGLTLGGIAGLIRALLTS